jgi:mannose-6-phosphate isomerase-like protein (cupin superfamily)
VSAVVTEYVNVDASERGIAYPRQGGGMSHMKTTTLPEHPDAKSPAGADIRFVMDGETGNMIHSNVPPHQVNRATVHASVSEFWYVLGGHGEIWRDDGLESRVDVLASGTSVDIPVGAAFQYRNVADEETRVHLRVDAAVAG